MGEMSGQMGPGQMGPGPMGPGAMGPGPGQMGGQIGGHMAPGSFPQLGKKQCFFAGFQAAPAFLPARGFGSKQLKAK